MQSIPVLYCIEKAYAYDHNKVQLLMILLLIEYTVEGWTIRPFGLSFVVSLKIEVSSLGIGISSRIPFGGIFADTSVLICGLDGTQL